MQPYENARPYRLALDLGSTSLGWAALDLKRDVDDLTGVKKTRIDPKTGEIIPLFVPCGLRKAGVRLFSDGRDPQDKTSLAVARRIARQMRRRRDRYLTRRSRLLAALIRFGLMPADPAERKDLAGPLDPYELRNRGAVDRLEPYELGRALFHLNQRRGFKANRKTDGDPDEQGKIKTAVDLLAADIKNSGAPTLGAYFAWRKKNRETVRARLTGVGAKASYPFYPAREMLEAEFDKLWATQACFHPALLTAEARDDLRRRIFFQRPLKPIKPGKCTFFPEEERAPRALPSAQRFRLLTELNNLRLIYPDRSEQFLTPDQRRKIADEIRNKSSKKITFKRIRRLLKVGSEVGFNIESEKRPDLLGDETAALLAHKDIFGERWRSFTLAEQDDIVLDLLGEADESRLLDRLVDHWGLPPAGAAKAAGLRLPQFHASIGRKALALILPHLENGVEFDKKTRLPRHLRYDEAAKAAGLHHSDMRPDGLLDQLPYYGAVLTRFVAFGSGEPRHDDERRLGRIANPTVHVGLNQLRHLVNDIVKRYGRPTEIVVELARDLKNGAEERKKQEREQTKNQQNNERRRQEIIAAGRAATPHNMAKMRIWEEQKQGDVAQCPYSGTVISLTMLLSEEVDIDHILPFSKTLDDGAANKVVCLSRMNRRKTNKTPYEAFGHDPDRWAEITARVEDLPKPKQWRFAPDALEKFNEKGGFEGRQLNDTRYLSRLAREYLLHVCPKVRASPGRLTALLRARWGLNAILNTDNQKNRDDHRHHAVDAVVIGCIDQRMVQQVATARGREEEEELMQVLKNCPAPWGRFRDDFRDAVKAGIDRLIVSHRPEHGTGGRMHEDTAYGPIDPAAHDGFNLVRRKPADGLSEKDVFAVRDKGLRDALAAALAAQKAIGDKDHKAALPQALAALRADPRWEGLRHVRVMTKEAKPILMPDAAGKIYKGLIAGEIHHIDLFADARGRWTGRAATLFEARKTALPDGRAAPPQAQEGESFVMRLHKGDKVMLEKDGETIVYRVYRLEPANGRFRLAPHHEGGELDKRHNEDNELDPFRWLIISYDVLRKHGARRVTVDRLGDVHPVRQTAQKAAVL